MKTWKNKLTAIALLGLGYMMIAMENDATIFVLFAIFAIPIFFAKKLYLLRGGALTGLFLFSFSPI